MVRRPIDYVFEGKDEVFLGTWLGQMRGVFGEMVQNLFRAEMGPYNHDCNRGAKIVTKKN